MSLRLPKRPHRRARFLIITGLILLIVSFAILTYISNNINKQSDFTSNPGLKIICGLDLAVLIVGTAILFWGMSVWIRTKVFRS